MPYNSFLNVTETDSDASSEGDQEEEWEELDEDNTPVKCLFCQECFADAQQVWTHCHSTHGFSVHQIKHKHGKLCSN